MKNVGVVASRVLGSCLSLKAWLPPVQVLRRALALNQCTSTGLRNTSRITSPTTKLLIWNRTPGPRAFSSSTKLSFRQSFAAQAFKEHSKRAAKTKEEKGLAFQKGDLTQEELHDVFGAVTPPIDFANRLLRVLNGRRYDGTLDLPLPKYMDAMLKKYPYAVESGLHWLRTHHAIDEDAAIEARIEREDSGENWSPAETEQRAFDLGLYAPQSGNYQAKLSKDKQDVFGESELDNLRAANIAEAEREEAELQAQIDQIQAEVQEQQTKALAERPETGIEETKEFLPPNEFEKWVLKAKNRAQTKLTLDEVSTISRFKRLLPSAIFVALVCAGSYVFAQYWVPPKRSERIFPETSLSFATVGVLVAFNVAIYGSWSLPFMWRFLNTFFISTPSYPRAFSMLGNVFSHQSGKHLLRNMVGLLVFGLSFHEDVGRGTFMGIYLACGALGSFTSLASFTARRLFVSSSLGASGSVWGIMAAYCWIHANEKFSFVFIPTEWQDQVQFTGWFFLSVLILSQVYGVLSPLKKIDYTSHVAGIAAGLVCAEWWKRNEDASGEKRVKKQSLRWYEILLGRLAGDK